MAKIYIQYYDLLRGKNSEIIWVSSKDSDQPGLASSLNICIAVAKGPLALLMRTVKTLTLLDAKPKLLVLSLSDSFGMTYVTYVEKKPYFYVAAFKKNFYLHCFCFSADNSMRGIVGDDQIGTKEHTREVRFL